jgi:hypothetical protein
LFLFCFSAPRTTTRGPGKIFTARRSKHCVIRCQETSSKRAISEPACTKWPITYTLHTSKPCMRHGAELDNNPRKGRRKLHSPSSILLSRLGGCPRFDQQDVSTSLRMSGKVLTHSTSPRHRRILLLNMELLQCVQV